MVFLDDMLSGARAEVAQAPMLALSLVNGQYIRISNEIPLGLKAWTFKQMTRFGVAQVITTRQNSVPLVEDAIEEFLVRVFPIRLGYELEQDDIEIAQTNGVNIATPKMMTVKEGIERELDIIAYEGKPQTTLRGIANNPNITVLSLPADGAGSSAAWSSKTPVQIVRDLNLIVLSLLGQTSNTVSANRLLMPISKVNLINTTPYNTTTGESILTTFLKNQANLPFGGIKEVIGHPALEAAGTSGVGRIIAYDTTSRYNVFHIPQGGDFRDLPYERQGSTIKVIAQMKTAGVEIQRIKEVIYADVT